MKQRLMIWWTAEAINYKGFNIEPNILVSLPVKQL